MQRPRRFRNREMFHLEVDQGQVAVAVLAFGCHSLKFKS